MSSEVDLEAVEGPLVAIGSTGLSRREMLKKGAIIGGTVVWAVPAVEFVGTKLAAAQSNPVPATCFVGPFTNASTFANSTVTFTYVVTATNAKETLVISVNSAATGFTIKSGSDPFGLTLPAPSEIQGTIPSGDVLQGISVQVVNGGTQSSQPFKCTTDSLFVLTGGE